MGLSTFLELRESVITWSNRNDLDKLIPDFIRLAEVDMFKNNRSHESLQTRAMEQTSTADMTSTIALPDGFKQMRNLRYTDSRGGDLIPKTPDTINRRSGTGRPCFFSVTTEIQFDITPDQEYPIEMSYFRIPDPLTAINSTNFILTNNPDIYLFGTLAALFARSVDTEQKDNYYRMFSEAINGANQEADEGRFGPAPAAQVNGSIA